MTSRGPDFHQKKRAELVARVVARKARVHHLLDLRVRALQASARKWPRPRCHDRDKKNERQAEGKQREEQAHKAAMHAQERAARVDILMGLRTAGGNGRRRYYY